MFASQYSVFCVAQGQTMASALLFVDKIIFTRLPLKIHFLKDSVIRATFFVQIVAQQRCVAS